MKSLFSVLLLLVSFQAWSQEQIKERVGYARDMDNGELLYVETHEDTYYDDVIKSSKVTYRNSEGKIIAEKELDYSQAITMPDFKLVNFETGHQEAVSKRDEELEVIFASNKEARKESVVISLPEEAIIDAGFDRFVMANWQELTSGEQFVRQMLIPSLKTFVDFRIYQESIDEQGQTRTLKVEPDSMFFRFLTNPLVLQYDYSTPRLAAYTGTSNMRNASGNNLQVIITFPPEEVQVTQK